MYQLKWGQPLKLGLLCLALAACAPTRPASTVASFRTAGAPLWSNAQFDPARLVGTWRQAATFAVEDPGCAPGGSDIKGRAGALTLAARLCLAGREVRLAGPLVASGPGRFRADGQDWWVIGVDTDYRTLAIGTPSGAFGFILNRGGPLPSDRLRAAKEIFDFNGYDTRYLHAF